MRFLFGAFVLDLDRRELRLGADPVALEPLVFDLLVYLVTNRDRVVSKDNILDAVWSGRAVSESALSTRVAAARRAIGDNGEAQTLIRTIARKGFRFVGAVKQEDGGAAVPLPQGDATAPLPLPGKPSIAVLPFANLSSDPEQAYFSDGMAADIVTELSHDRSLFVIARNSSFTFKDGTVNTKSVARELGVRYVLEGSSRRDGERIRVNVQLIDAETSSNVWAERYDRTVENVFAVQDEIAVAVARAIHPAISHAERQRVMRKSPDSLSAWEAWHRALGLISRRDISGFRDFVQRALALDPGFAPAHAMLAFFMLAEATRGIGPSLEVGARLAEAEARTATELDPNSAIAHSVLAWVFGHQGDWALGLEEAEIAITLNDNDPWGHLSKGHILTYSGRPTLAKESLATALRLDPRGPTRQVVMQMCALGSYWQRDYLSAEAMARRAIRESPENPRIYLVFAASLGQLGRASDARSALDAAVSASSSHFDFITKCGPGYYRPEDHAHLLAGLRKAGWKG